MSVSSSCFGMRKLIWRLGRKLYTLARGDVRNDPRSNGEYWLLQQVLNSASDTCVLLDIGANKGDWSAYALKIAPPPRRLRIHAFEPCEATRDMLRSRFGGEVGVTIQSDAVSDHSGESVLYSSESGAGTNSLSPISGATAEKIHTTTVDSYLGSAGIDRVAMIKVDTEGFDFLVLKGAENSLREGRVEVVQFEYNWRWLLNHACLLDVFNFIAEKPYRLGKLLGDAIEFYPKWHFELDRFFENNFVLVKAGSALNRLGSEVAFDESNVPVKSGPS